MEPPGTVVVRRRSWRMLASPRRHRRSDGRSENGTEEVQADLTGSPLPDGVRLRGDHEADPGEVAAGAAAQEGRPQQQRAHHDAPPGRRPQAPLPRRSTSSATRTACRPRSPRSSTTRTARRASRCCTTPTARSATSWRRKGLKVGDTVQSGPGADIKPGNALPLSDIPVGTVVHAVELQPGKGAALARSAGTSIQLMGKEGDYAILRMPSSEMRRVLVTCRATIGEVGNAEHGNIAIGKAGRTRWMGKRPTRPRHGHEPGRPPARRWRGQEQVRRSPPGHPVGRADARATARAARRRPRAASSSVAARSSATTRKERDTSMSRSLKRARSSSLACSSGSRR